MMVAQFGADANVISLTDYWNMGYAGQAMGDIWCCTVCSGTLFLE